MNELYNDSYDRSSYSISWRYTNHLTVKMTSAQVVETSFNVISNSPAQDYTLLTSIYTINPNPNPSSLWRKEKSHEDCHENHPLKMYMHIFSEAQS